MPEHLPIDGDLDHASLDSNNGLLVLRGVGHDGGIGHGTAPPLSATANADCLHPRPAFLWILPRLWLRCAGTDLFLRLVRSGSTQP